MPDAIQALKAIVERAPFGKHLVSNILWGIPKEELEPFEWVRTFYLSC